ncbi:hypothetical protein B0H14DRAFT_3445901 [Mycena olivaceomarginata]|nr:hypothetical protein B0H14DRAFT_3445901 [Mycena olivaceomarginata]
MPPAHRTPAHVISVRFDRYSALTTSSRTPSAFSDNTSSMPSGISANTHTRRSLAFRHLRHHRPLYFDHTHSYTAHLRPTHRYRSQRNPVIRGHSAPPEVCCAQHICRHLPAAPHTAHATRLFAHVCLHPLLRINLSFFFTFTTTALSPPACPPRTRTPTRLPVPARPPAHARPLMLTPMLRDLQPEVCCAAQHICHHLPAATHTADATRLFALSTSPSCRRPPRPSTRPSPSARPTPGSRHSLHARFPPPSCPVRSVTRFSAELVLAAPASAPARFSAVFLAHTLDPRFASIAYSNRHPPPHTTPVSPVSSRPRASERVARSGPVLALIFSSSSSALRRPPFVAHAARWDTPSSSVRGDAVAPRSLRRPSPRLSSPEFEVEVDVAWYEDWRGEGASVKDGTTLTFGTLYNHDDASDTAAHPEPPRARLDSTSQSDVLHVGTSTPTKRVCEAPGILDPSRLPHAAVNAHDGPHASSPTHAHVSSTVRPPVSPFGSGLPLLPPSYPVRRAYAAREEQWRRSCITFKARRSGERGAAAIVSAGGRRGYAVWDAHAPRPRGSTLSLSTDYDACCGVFRAFANSYGMCAACAISCRIASRAEAFVLLAMLSLCLLALVPSSASPALSGVVVKR